MSILTNPTNDELKAMLEKHGIKSNVKPFWGAGTLLMFRALLNDPTGTGESDKRILWGVVANAGRLSSRPRQRWAHVMDATGLGSTKASELCRRFNFDPDEVIGSTDDEGSDDE